MLRHPETKHIIGIIGNARHGKDTIAQILLNHYKNDYAVNIIHFADALKRSTDALFCTSGMDKTDRLPGFNEVTVRGAYQRMGDAIKNEFGKDIFIRLLDMQIGPLTEVVLIPDVRFEDEADYIIRQHGTLIHVNRPDMPVDLSHRSEHFPHFFDAYVKIKTHAAQIHKIVNTGLATLEIDALMLATEELKTRQEIEELAKATEKSLAEKQKAYAEELDRVAKEAADAAKTSAAKRHTYN